VNPDVVHILEEHDIQPTAQRVAVAEYVLRTQEHPSADNVWAVVGESFPVISRATVYNTLNLYVEKGLLRECISLRTRCSSIQTQNAIIISSMKRPARSMTSRGNRWK
jgi:Fe2+ or Zn2+ uptake regulation protein